MEPTVLNRRAFLGHASALATIAASAAFDGCERARPVAPGSDEWTALSATAATAAMRKGDTTAEAYATALLARVARLKHLNAFRVVDRDVVLAAARAADKARTSGARLGLLHGLPIPVKDSINTVAYPTSGGTRILEHFQPKADAAVLTPLVAHGAYVMGKTNLHELSAGYTSNNPYFGAVRNPYDVERVPGGSSGGSAAAVAARMAPLALGEDTAGSIRVPASWCGICGLRPTYGRYPNAGMMTLTDSFDQVGAMARAVEDLVLFDTVLTGDASPVVPESLRGVRLGIPNQLMTDLEADVERVVAAALARLENAGSVLVRIDMPEVAMKAAKPSQVIETIVPILKYERLRAIRRFLDAEGTGVTLEQLVASMGDDPKDIPPPASPAVYEEAMKARAALQEVVRSRFKEHNIAALVYPTTHERAPKIGDEGEITWQGQRVPWFLPLTRSMLLVTCCGHPGLSLPAGLTTDGLPIGIEFDGIAGADRRLLALGLALETALGAIPAPKV